MNTIRKAIIIKPKTNRHRNNELPSFLYSYHGFLISALSFTTLYRNINFPRELSQARTIARATRNTKPHKIRIDQNGCETSQSHAVCGNEKNSSQFSLLPGLLYLLLLFQLFPWQSDKPAKKAVKPIINHFPMSKGWNSAFFIRSHPRVSGIP